MDRPETGGADEFTESKVQTDAALVTEWLNDASTALNPTEKLELLCKVKEYVVHKSPQLLPEFLPIVVGFVSDRSADVKRWLVGFIEEACKVNENVLLDITMTLHMLLMDESIKVQKKVIQAASSIYRRMLNYIGKAPVINEEITRAWNQLNNIKFEIVNMIDSDNDGIRTNAVKFLEGVVTLQSYPEAEVSRKDQDFSLQEIPLTLKIVRRRKLEEEANQIFNLLIKFHGSPHISSVNLMACMGSLCNLARLRPDFMPRVVAALESLHSNLPPTLTHSQVSSVRKHLKLQLLNILKHPTSGDLINVITSLLADLGCNAQEIAKSTLRPEERRRLNKRALEVPDQPLVASKRQKVEPEDMDDLKLAALEANEEFVAENLGLDVATQIVMASMKNLPPVAPQYFLNTFVSLSGEATLKKAIVLLLGKQVTEAGLGPGAKRVKKEPGDALASKDHKKIKPRMRTLRLAEITRPVDFHIKEDLLMGSVGRLLFARTSFRPETTGVQHKIIATIASTFNARVREYVLRFLLSDLRANIELALGWLYEEYSYMQNYNRMPDVLERDEKVDHSYTVLLSTLISSVDIDSNKDRDGLLARLYLECPKVTSEAIDILSAMCRSERKCTVALSLMHDLALLRPPRSEAYLRVLLACCLHESAAVRDEAGLKVLSLYEKLAVLRPAIEEHSVVCLRHLCCAHPPPALFGEEKGRPGPGEAWTEPMTKACLHLYLALLPFKEGLVHELSRVYTQTQADTKRVILRLLEAPIRSMGMDSPELLALVETCPKGAETLVTRVIHILTDRGPPSQQLVDRVRDLYQTRVSDVRFLIPVLNGLTKREVVSALPKLIKLNPVVVKEVFNRLLGLHGDSPISPADLLISLHLMDQSKAELKTVMKATSLCFAEKQVYTQEVLAVVMQQLMEVTPLPTLLMRTVIQSLALFPRLSGFVMNILQRLILKQVWKQKIVWEGFIKCCQRTRPQSFHVLLQLPSPQLAEALSLCPELRQPLLDHVQTFTDSQRTHIPSSVMEVLAGKAYDQTILMPEKSPIDNGNDVSMDGDKEDSRLSEPLPPGMD